MQRIAVVCFAMLLAYGHAGSPARAGQADTLRADARAEHDKRKAVRKARPVADRPYGREGDPRKVKRVITIDMSDTMRFFPDQVRVKRGDTIRFVLRNRGELRHAMAIGTMEELKKQASLMKQHPATDETDAYGAAVAAGETGELVWLFTRAGEFHYACLVPGHYDAGMIGTIVVRP